MHILRHLRTVLPAIFGLALLLPAPGLAQADEISERKEIVLLEIDGAIGPATADHVIRGIEDAEENGAELIVLRMDTPGGLDTAMRDMIKAILASEVPVASFVAPEGSRAASAGTYLLYASHIAAMAPATNLGAATPVQIGGGGGVPDPTKKKPAQDGEESDDEAGAEEAPAIPDDAKSRKAINDAVAYIRGLADKRGRNADWAEQAVREAVSLPAKEALEKNVIDMVATDIDDLLQKVDGLEISTAIGSVTLDTANASVRKIEPDWRNEVLSTITDPTIAYLLMLIGIYGLIFEGYNPGAIVPGVIGAICLLLALYAFQVLPVNSAGLALILLGVVLMIAEVFAPSFGALGLGGVAAFVIGSIILMDTDVPGYAVPLPLILGLSITSAVVVGGTMWLLVRSRSTDYSSGKEELIGSVAVATRDFEGRGYVRIHGESWQAECETPVRKGDRLKVTAMNGLILDVEPTEQED